MTSLRNECDEMMSIMLLHDFRITLARLFPLTGQFDGFLASKTFNRELDDSNTIESALYLGFQCRFVIRVVALAEQVQCAEFFGFILDDTHASEADDTAEVGGEGLGMYLVGANDGERRAVAVAYGVELVAAECRMEIKFVVSVDIADWHSIGIATVVDEREYARCGIAKQGDGLLFGQLLATAAHRSLFVHNENISLSLIPQHYSLTLFISA